MNFIFFVIVGVVDRKGLYFYYLEMCVVMMVVVFFLGSGDYIVGYCVCFLCLIDFFCSI